MDIILAMEMEMENEALHTVMNQSCVGKALRALWILSHRFHLDVALFSGD